jgi:hypothetical protein
MKVGFEYCKQGEVLYLLVNNEMIRDPAEFSEIWCINFPVEELLAWRRAQKWGLMN